MDINIRFFRGNTPLAHVPICVQETLKGLSDFLLDKPQITKRSGSSTNQIKEVLKPWFKEATWSARASIDNRFPRTELPAANYDLDWQLECGCKTQDLNHLMSVEYAFDNRQAIGTNLLKMETMAMRVSKSQKFEAFGILLTGTRPFLNAGGWDSGIASTEEYENALIHGYDQILSSNFVFVSFQS